MASKNQKAYIVKPDKEYSVTKVKLIEKTDEPRWTKEDVWKGEVLEDGKHYKRGEIIFGKPENLYETKKEIEQLKERLEVDLVYNK